jgi:cytochrome c biogenesis protein CcmG, thiol:disulfide interchange protein DsbE
MKRSAIPVVAAVLSIALVALLVYGITSKGGDKTLDDAVKQGHFPTAPGASLARPNLNGGGDTTLASLHGKIVVLNFWASWCEPCSAEAPVLESAQKQLVQASGGTVLGATFNDTPSDTRAFLKEHGLTYPNVRDVDTDLARKYGTIALPETFVINGQGKVVAISRGQLNQTFLDRAIAKARQTDAA